jgi:hypothetical protein
MIRGISKYSFKKIIGLLVLLSYAISDFTLAAYQRHSLWRPCMEISSCGEFRA